MAACQAPTVVLLCDGLNHKKTLNSQHFVIPLYPFRFSTAPYPPAPSPPHPDPAHSEKSPKKTVHHGTFWCTPTAHCMTIMLHLQGENVVKRSCFMRAFPTCAYHLHGVYQISC